MYNCQLAVDSDHHVIVATVVSNQAPEVEHLEPMVQRIWLFSSCAMGCG